MVLKVKEQHGDAWLGSGCGLAGGWSLDTCKGHITAEGPRLLLQTTHDNIWTCLNHVAWLAAGCYASAFAFLFLSELNCVSQKEIKGVCGWEEGRGKKKKRLKLKNLGLIKVVWSLVMLGIWLEVNIYSNSGSWIC